MRYHGNKRREGKGMTRRIDIILNKLNETTKISLYELIKYKEWKPITSTSLSEQLNIARYNISRELSKLYQENKVIRIEDKPICFLATREVEKILTKELKKSTFKNADDFRNFLLANTASYDSGAFSELIGYNQSLMTAVKQAKAAILYPPNGLHTLLVGPTGSGKSAFARVMYNYSIESHTLPKSAPFIIFNCADYSNNPELLLDQLFGHKKNAFTGASSEKSGIVDKANGGILFLDEVHRFPAEGQEMLFSLMDRGEYFKLGESSVKSRSNVLIIAATTEKPEEALLSTFLRRIPIVIEISGLEDKEYGERMELIYFFFHQEATNIGQALKVANTVISFLLQYDCPGNIGQIKNDIKLICANAFVDSVTQQSEYINVKLTHLSNFMLEQFYVINNHRDELLNKVGIAIDKEIVFHSSDSPYRPIIDSFDEDQSFYDHLLIKMKKYSGKGFSSTRLKEIIGEEITKRLEITKAAKNNDSFFKIVSKKNYKIISDILQEVTKIYLLDIDLNTIRALALHVDTLLKRLQSGRYKVQELIPDQEKIAKELINDKEYEVAQFIQMKLVEKIGVNLPVNEVLFLTLFLKAINNEEPENDIGILVMTHGNCAATDFADTTNQLLKTDHAHAINMPLKQDIKTTLVKAEKMVKKINHGKGVLILSDMGSLNNFGEIIGKKNDIPIRTITMVSTPMVIEATRKAMLPNMTLERLADDVVKLSSYIGNNGDTPNEDAFHTEVLKNEDSEKDRLIKLLENNLIFINPSVVYDYAYTIASKIIEKYNIENRRNFWIKFLFHVNFMIERCIRKNTFINKKTDELIRDHHELYLHLKSEFKIIENRYGTKIPDPEFAYIMELILLNISYLAIK